MIAAPDFGTLMSSQRARPVFADRAVVSSRGTESRTRDKQPIVP